MNFRIARRRTQKRSSMRLSIRLYQRKNGPSRGRYPYFRNVALFHVLAPHNSSCTVVLMVMRVPLTIPTMCAIRLPEESYASSVNVPV